MKTGNSEKQTCMIRPLNISRWIIENGELLAKKGYVHLNDDDLLTMIVTGPNRRVDFHVNPSEELLFQLKGGLVLRVVEFGKFKDIQISEGDLFRIPAFLPHLPIRGKGTIGIVVEKKRGRDQVEKLQWYCEKCAALKFEIAFNSECGCDLKTLVADGNRAAEGHICLSC